MLAYVGIMLAYVAHYKKIMNLGFLLKLQRKELIDAVKSELDDVMLLWRIFGLLVAKVVYEYRI